MIVYHGTLDILFTLEFSKEEEEEKEEEEAEEKSLFKGGGEEEEAKGITILENTKYNNTTANTMYKASLQVCLVPP